MKTIPCNHQLAPVRCLTSLALLGLLCLCHPVRAKEPPVPPGSRELKVIPSLQTLPEYLEYAALHHAGLKAAFHRWKAALERIPQARSLPDPKFTYGYYIREVETRVGPQNQRFGLAQTFPWFGKLSLRGERAGAAAEAAHQAFESEKLSLYYEVKRLYHEYSHLRQAILITEENIGLLKSFEGVAQARLRAGDDASGVLKAQVEIGKLMDRLASLRDLRHPLVAQLNAALNRPIDQPLPWPAEPAVSQVSSNDLTEIGYLADTNPELKRLHHQVRKASRDIELARKDFYPDVTLGVDYLETGSARNSGISDSGEDAIIAMVSINLPIWRGKYRAGLREAQRRHQAAQRDQDQRANTLEAELKMALYQFRDAERQLTLHKDTLTPLARNSLGVARRSYETGKADFLELIDAQRLLLEFQLAYERALADREQRLAQIEMLTGREIASPAQEGRKPQP